MKNLILLILSLGLMGCSHAVDQIVNAPVDQETSRPPITYVFDTAHNLKLDVYVPSEVSQKKRDVVIFFYGGSWQNGARGFYRFVAQTLTRQGFIVVIPDYRKYPQVVYPDFLYDTAAAVAWTYRHIHTHGGNAARIHLLGHSAGAYNAAMVAANPIYLERFSLKPAKAIRSVAGLAGPYAFEPNTRKLKTIFAATDENWARMQVPSYISTHTPPMLLIHGGQDNLVGAFNAERLFAAFEKNRVPSRLQIYPDLGHVGVIRGFSWLATPSQRSVQNAVIDFFKAY
jgi:acetyl esterase/lipase